MRETSSIAFCQIRPNVRYRIGAGHLDAIITLERVSGRTLDSDNWVSACKAVRDGIADACSLTDAAPHLRFQYKQTIQSKVQEVWAEVSVVPTAPGYAAAWAQKQWLNRKRREKKTHGIQEKAGNTGHGHPDGHGR